MIDQLRKTCRNLLEEKKVQMVIGYGQTTPDQPAHPLIVTRPEDTDRLVWDFSCYSNLSVYLTRKELRSLGKLALIVKGCDEKALVVLEKESQIKREDITVIGMACNGMGNPLLPKCEVCDVRLPRFADYVIGQTVSPPVDTNLRWKELRQFQTKSQPQRMEYWREELSRCIKCYACRQVCPLCYCERCLTDKNRPTCIDTSANLKGNFAWNITRAFHLAGRCVGCDECTRVCPAGIDLRLLNQSLAKAAEEHFGYRAGMDPQIEPAIGTYSLQDKETFIR
jgi:formate dehydrogenase subunit beta